VLASFLLVRKIRQLKTEILERLLDRSIQAKADALPDLLNHEKVAINVISTIEQTPKTEESPCIAIFGPWGTGKTGILNLIGRRLNPEKFVWYQIDAWHNQRGDLVILEILRMLFHSAGPDFKDVFLRLIWAFSGQTIPSLVTTFIPDPINPQHLAEAIHKAYPHGVPSSRESLIKAEFAKLTDRLTFNGAKRLVLAIDNLDRCRPEAAIHVLETLHLITHVPHCAFIIAADQQVLVSFLNREYRETDFSGTKYLEKVFPYYFRVPDPWVAWSHNETVNEGDEVIALLEFLIDKESAWRRDPDTFKLLWHFFSQPRALRNPRRIKRILRRVLYYTFDEKNLKKLPQSEIAQNLLFLVILSDLWPEAYEFFLTTTHVHWRGWLDYMSTGEGNPHPSWVLTQDRDLQGFLYEVMKYNKRTFDNTVIGIQKDLAQYLKVISNLGL
jgi:hypothetical protein